MASSDKAKQLRQDYKDSFGGDAGGRVLRNLAKQFHMGVSSHIQGDPYETAFREGERHVILHIMDMLGERNDPTQLGHLLDQAQTDHYEFYTQDN